LNPGSDTRIDMNDNGNNIPVPIPLESRSSDVRNTWNTWRQEICGDHSLPPLADNSFELPGTTHTQPVSLATYIENASLKIPEIRLTSTAGARQMNALDSVCAPSLGDNKSAVSTKKSHSFFNQIINVASIPQGTAYSMIAGHQSDVRHGTIDSSHAARSNIPIQLDRAPNPPSSNMSSAATLKSNTEGMVQLYNPGRDSWNQKYDLLRKYNDENGNCDVPQKCPVLGAWVNKQRMEKKKLDKGGTSSMTQKRHKLLESIGFKWAKPRPTWNDSFKEIQEFEREFGHCIVPTKKYKNTALGRWVTEQRAKRKSGDLDKDKERKLNSLGFFWDLYDKGQS